MVVKGWDLHGIKSNGLAKGEFNQKKKKKKANKLGEEGGNSRRAKKKKKREIDGQFGPSGVSLMGSFSPGFYFCF